MTFNEYLCQDNKQATGSVEVTEQDAYHTYTFNNEVIVVVLKIMGEYFSYRVGNYNHMYTMDGDGNTKSLSVFKWKQE